MGNLFGSVAIEVAISLALFFLLISLACTAIREAIEAVMKSRAIDLERCLREMLNDGTGEGLVKSFFNHPVIFGLYTGNYDPKKLTADSGFASWLKRILLRPIMALFGQAAWRNLPSYIPSGHFSATLVDLVARGDSALSTGDAGTLDVAALRVLVAQYADPKIQRIMLTAIDTADNDLNKVKANLESWYDGAMDRVTGWYQRRTRRILFCCGLALAIMFNLDAVTMTKLLLSNSELRSEWVKRGEQQVEQQVEKGTPAATAKEEVDAARAAALKAHEDSVLNPTDNSKKLVAEQTAAKYDNIKKYTDPVIRSIQDINAPMGWNHVGCYWSMDSDAARPKTDKLDNCLVAYPQRGARGKLVATTFPAMVGIWLEMFIGWMVTALAVTLGAPFWFDMLAKFVNIRSTMKPAAKEKTADAPVSAAPAVVVLAQPQPQPQSQPLQVQGTTEGDVFVPRRWAIGDDPDAGDL